MDKTQLRLHAVTLQAAYLASWATPSGADLLPVLGSTEATNATLESALEEAGRLMGGLEVRLV